MSSDWRWPSWILVTRRTWCQVGELTSANATLAKYTASVARGALCYLSHIAMCGLKGYVFKAVLVRKRDRFWPFWCQIRFVFLHIELELGMCFREYLLARS